MLDFVHTIVGAEANDAPEDPDGLAAIHNIVAQDDTDAATDRHEDPEAQEDPEDRTGFKRKGSWHAKYHMLNARAKQIKARPSCSTHVQKKINRANSQLVVRSRDVIKENLAITKRADRPRGKGTYKHWTAEALLRASFGNFGDGPRAPKKIRCTRRQGISNPTAESARSTGQHFQAGHQYIQQIRNAVSKHVFDVERRAVSREDCTLFRSFRLALDETETPVRIENECTFAHLLMMHGNLYVKTASAAKETGVALPCVTIDNQSTECVMNAVDKIVGPLLWGTDALVTTLVVNSDSHPALIKLAKLFAKKACDSVDHLIGILGRVEFRKVLSHPRLRQGVMLKLSIHGRCVMHMYFAAV